MKRFPLGIFLVHLLFASAKYVRGSMYFDVFWQVPTESCHNYGMFFKEVSDYGIIQNTGDIFQGDRNLILYDPGDFPTLEPYSNGGLPQNGDLDKHLAAFEEDVNRIIPNRDFNGLAIIDFEHWRPVFRENWSKLDPYREESRRQVSRQHPFWSKNEVEAEARRRFELASFAFFRRTLEKAKWLRPRALWGYYGFPYCFNFAPNNQRMQCTDAVQEDNDRSGWMWGISDALYPSVYFSDKGMTEQKRAKLIQGRVKEGIRMSSKRNKLLYIYTWFKYQDTRDFITLTDMRNNLHIPMKYGANGTIIWGSTKDVNTREKCEQLLDYLRRVIGPAVRNLRNIRNFDSDENEGHNNVEQ